MLKSRGNLHYSWLVVHCKWSLNVAKVLGTLRLAGHGKWSKYLYRLNEAKWFRWHTNWRWCSLMVGSTYQDDLEFLVKSHDLLILQQSSQQEADTTITKYYNNKYNNMKTFHWFGSKNKIEFNKPLTNLRRQKQIFVSINFYFKAMPLLCLQELIKFYD